MKSLTTATATFALCLLSACSDVAEAPPGTRTPGVEEATPPHIPIAAFVTAVTDSFAYDRPSRDAEPFLSVSDGETFRLLEEAGDWYRIDIDVDGPVWVHAGDVVTELKKLSGRWLAEYERRRRFLSEELYHCHEFLVPQVPDSHPYMLATCFPVRGEEEDRVLDPGQILRRGSRPGPAIWIRLEDGTQCRIPRDYVDRWEFLDQRTLEPCDPEALQAELDGADSL